MTKKGKKRPRRVPEEHVAALIEVREQMKADVRAMQQSHGLDQIHITAAKERLKDASDKVHKL